MTLKETLNEDLKKALKSGEQFKVGVLRLLSSAIHNREIDAKSKTGSYELSDEAVLQVLMAEAKKRKEAIGVFEKGGRPELSEKERKELGIIQNYLPKELGPEETEKAAAEIIKRTGANDFGGAMKAVMKELRGKADAKLVGEIVKKLIAN